MPPGCHPGRFVHRLTPQYLPAQEALFAHFQPDSPPLPHPPPCVSLHRNHHTTPVQSSWQDRFDFRKRNSPAWLSSKSPPEEAYWEWSSPALPGHFPPRLNALPDKRSFVRIRDPESHRRYRYWLPQRAQFPSDGCGFHF